MDKPTRQELLQIMTPETDEQLRWAITTICRLSEQAVLHPSGSGGGLVGGEYDKRRARLRAEVDAVMHAADTVLTDIAAKVDATGATHGTSGGARRPYIGFTDAQPR